MPNTILELDGVEVIFLRTAIVARIIQCQERIKEFEHNDSIVEEYQARIEVLNRIKAKLPEVSNDTN